MFLKSSWMKWSSLLPITYTCKGPRVYSQTLLLFLLILVTHPTIYNIGECWDFPEEQSNCCGLLHTLSVCIPWAPHPLLQLQGVNVSGVHLLGIKKDGCYAICCQVAVRPSDSFSPLAFTVLTWDSWRTFFLSHTVTPVSVSLKVVQPKFRSTIYNVNPHWTKIMVRQDEVDWYGTASVT